MEVEGKVHTGTITIRLLKTGTDMSRSLNGASNIPLVQSNSPRPTSDSRGVKVLSTRHSDYMAQAAWPKFLIHEKDGEDFLSRQSAKERCRFS